MIFVNDACVYLTKVCLQGRFWPHSIALGYTILILIVSLIECHKLGSNRRLGLKVTVACLRHAYQSQFSGLRVKKEVFEISYRLCGRQGVGNEQKSVCELSKIER